MLDAHRTAAQQTCVCACPTHVAYSDGGDRFCPFSIKFSPDNREVRFFDVRVLDAATHLTNFMVSSARQVIAGANDGCVYVYDVERMALLHKASVR